MSQKKKDKGGKEEIMSFVKEYLDISEIGDTLEVMESKLNNLNYARVFICLYYLKEQGVQYTKRLIAKRTNIEQSNLNYYLNYFVNQGFVKIIPISKGSKRNCMVKTCNNDSNKELWEKLIKVAIKTIIDKEKRKDEII